MLTRRELLELAGAATLSSVAIRSSADVLAGEGSPAALAGGLVATADAGRPLEAAADAGDPAAAGGGGLRFCFFSKHLSDLNVGDLASAVIDMGYDAIDLTVRPGGHVLPEKVADDLPRALDTIRTKGTAVAMITTGLVSPTEPTARSILQAAAKAGIKLVKPGYWKYTLKDVRGEIASMAKDVAGLAALAKEYGVELGVHNHTGYIGASIWDLAPHMDTLDARSVGYYFDPRHAVVEGGGVGWKTATLLVGPRLKMIAVKDFYWEKDAKANSSGGAWKIKSCPIGEGMVDWPWFASAIVAAKFAGPISQHFEYEIPGASKAEVAKNTMAAGKRDLAFIRQRFAEVHA
jgi:L-ribulose-5-phosphate 3-epimerase